MRALSKNRRKVTQSMSAACCGVLLLFLVSAASSASKPEKPDSVTPVGPAYNHNSRSIQSSNANVKRIVSGRSVIPINFIEVPHSSNSTGSGDRNASRKTGQKKPVSATTETPVPAIEPTGETSRKVSSSPLAQWPGPMNVTRALVNKSLRRLKGKLEKAAAAAANKNNKSSHRGSRGPPGEGLPPITTAGASSVRSFANATAPTGGPSSAAAGKSGQTKEGKQSWLAVASAVAHSTAAETSDQSHNNQLSEDSSAKPTKYHYYPHNQHLYLLPECATQQVCSAVYLRLNYSQPLCACPNFHEPCSVSTRTDDRHTIPLVTGSNSQVLTLVKTCEPTQEVRECRAPKDWSILALQNSRTGKAHYLVICRCPSPGYLEGPIAHSQPAYARVPGIRVYGMTCVRYPNRTGKTMKMSRDSEARGPLPNFPWYKLKALIHSFT